LSVEQRKPLGYFQFHGGQWYLVNQALNGMMNMTDREEIKKGERLLLLEGQRILLSHEEGGRLIEVAMVHC